MSKVRLTMSMSLDGYVAGPNQSQDDPIGENGMQVMSWFMNTRTFKAMNGESGGDTGLDDERAAALLANVGATIMGRNMFGPIRGDWADRQWRGWWGENPSYHSPVFVLTHYPRESIEMAGGTTFHFVTDGPHAALERAREAAGSKNINIGGGAATGRQYLGAGLVDEMELHVAPVLLGRGERLFDDLGNPPAGLESTDIVCSKRAAHFRFARVDH
jgi:dihydrofolate reductase